MSYGKPKTSPYGDLDQFQDDANWAQTPPDSPQPPTSYNNVADASQVEPSRLMQSLTPEDVLFVRQWQRDSFYYRVLPFTAISYTAMALYNKSKGLPNKPFKFLGLTLVSYIAGKFSYRGEFVRRLAENPSNTPFMQTSRKMVRLPPIVPTDGFSTGAGNFNYSDSSAVNDSADWNSSEFSGQSQLSDLGNQRPPSYGQLPSDLPPAKQAVSYEELRAKNRGFTR